MPIAEWRRRVLYRFAHRNAVRYADAWSANAGAPARSSRFRDALNDSANALSADEPIAPIDCVTPKSVGLSEKRWVAVWPDTPGRPGEEGRVS